MSLFFSLVTLIVLSIVLGVLWITPFPHWPAYFRIWQHIFFDPEPSIGFRARLKQVNYLLKYTLTLPFIAFCWVLDDLLFPDYRALTIRNPVFIVAQPRSATTFLHRTLAADNKSFFSIRLL